MDEDPHGLKQAGLDFIAMKKASGDMLSALREDKAQLADSDPQVALKRKAFELEERLLTQEANIGLNGPGNALARSGIAPDTIDPKQYGEDYLKAVDEAKQSLASHVRGEAAVIVGLDKTLSPKQGRIIEQAVESELDKLSPLPQGVPTPMKKNTRLI